MQITTLKLRKSTKHELDEFRNKNESYDMTIKKIISKIKLKNLKNDLIEGYKSSTKNNLKILGEWENASTELD